KNVSSGESGSVPAVDFWERGGDVSGLAGLGLTGGFQTGLAQRIRVLPCARSVDHGPGQMVLDCPLGVLEPDQERGARPTGGAGLVHPSPGHGNQTTPGADTVGEG